MSRLLYTFSIDSLNKIQLSVTNVTHCVTFVTFGLFCIVPLCSGGSEATFT